MCECDRSEEPFAVMQCTTPHHQATRPPHCSVVDFIPNLSSGSRLTPAPAEHCSYSGCFSQRRGNATFPTLASNKIIKWTTCSSKMEFMSWRTWFLLTSSRGTIIILYILHTCVDQDDTWWKDHRDSPSLGTFGPIYVAIQGISTEYRGCSD